MHAVYASHSEHRWEARQGRDRRPAFTLIELLVVISIVALLMAILLSVLQGARDRARAVACQANLRQWGVLFEIDAAARDAAGDRTRYPPYDSLYWTFMGYPRLDPNWSHFGVPRKRPIAPALYLCPMASRLMAATIKPPPGPVDNWRRGAYTGDAFHAGWWSEPPSGQVWAWSYGMNWGLGYFGPGPMLVAGMEGPVPPNPLDGWMSRIQASARLSVPVLFDCTIRACSQYDRCPPPPYEDCPYQDGSCWNYVCLNRHHGGVNCLFRDWSVRKVGLKELWTLRWNADFVTYGPWTRAGGVQPEDWPPWMRRFKDY